MRQPRTLSDRFKNTLALSARMLFPAGLQRSLQDRFIYKPVMAHKGIGPGEPPLFDTAFFELRTRCNGICPFCPASVGRDPRPDLKMEKGLFVKVLDELAAIGFQGRVSFYSNSDPLIFGDLTEFVGIAREKLPQAYFHILTNGRALTAKKAEELFRAGITDLTVNFYNDDLRAEFPRPVRKILTEVLPALFAPEEILVSGFGPEFDHPGGPRKYVVTRRIQNEVLDNRAGFAPNKLIPDKRPRGFCQYPFTQFIVTADGRVGQCCNDFTIDEPMGDVSRQGVMEVWQGEPFQELRRELLAGRRENHRLCDECDYFGVKRIPEGLLSRFTHVMTR